MLSVVLGFCSNKLFWGFILNKYFSFFEIVVDPLVG